MPRPVTVVAVSVAPATVQKPPPDPVEQQALLDYSADLNHTNDGSIIERRWARSMQAVCGQMEAFEARRAGMSSSKRHLAKARGGDDDSRDSSVKLGSSRNSGRDKRKLNSVNSSR